MELERAHADVHQSTFLSALGNVLPRHVLETRLIPGPALRARAEAMPDARVPR